MGQIRFLGWAVIAGALAILVFNGVTLWHSAYDLNAKFPALAAWSVIGMLAIECLGLGIAMLLAKHKQRLMALAATVLTIVMAGYLLRLDLNFNVTGRSDREAQRELSIQERKSDQSELERQIKLRDALQGEKRLTEDQRDTLYEVRQRIKALEARWGAHETAPAEKAPEASWLSRWLGVDLQSADDFMQAMPVFANFLARLLCLPTPDPATGSTRSPRAAISPPSMARPTR